MRAMAGLMLCLAITLAGCGGGGDGSPTAPAATYTVGGTISGLSGGGLTLKNGADTLAVGANGTFTFPTKLTSGAGYSVTIGTQPSGPAQVCTVQNGSGTVANAVVTTIAVTCAASPSTFAYAAVPHSAANASIGLLEYFTFDAATGRLSLKGSLSAGADTYVFNVKAAPSGKQLLVSTSTVIDRVTVTLRNDLSLYSLSTATGAPAFASAVASPGNGELILSPNGSDLYVSGSTVYHYSLAPGVAQGQSLGIGLQPGLASAITPDGKFLFAPNTGQDNGFVPFIAIISLADPLRPQLLQKFATPTSARPLTATISPDGKLLYVTSIDPGTPGYVYRVDASGGLTQAGTFVAPTYARSAVVTPSGGFLYLASSDDNKVQGYALDASGGVTQLGTGVAVPSAFRLILGPDGKYLYALSYPVNGSPGAIYGFVIAADGSLSPVAGSPLMTGEREYDLAFATP